MWESLFFVVVHFSAIKKIGGIFVVNWTFKIILNSNSGRQKSAHPRVCYCCCLFVSDSGTNSGTNSILCHV